jgi:formylglycine-generating enzyme required for sulfatase activity
VFAGWVGERDPTHVYRLPKEAEWEHACRAGTRTAYFWGAEPSTGSRFANFADAAFKAATAPGSGATFSMSDGNASTAPVGSYAPNPWGLCDMAGNALEFTADGYAPFSTDPAVDPFTRPSGIAFALRGGAFCSPLSNARCAARVCARNERAADTGFRLAADLPEKR